MTNIMAKVPTTLLASAMNAATLVRGNVGQRPLAAALALTDDDLTRARHVLQMMQEDSMTSAFDRRDFLIANGWAPAASQMTGGMTK